jgi:hypothetical protein
VGQVGYPKVTLVLNAAAQVVNPAFDAMAMVQNFVSNVLAADQ